MHLHCRRFCRFGICSDICCCGGAADGVVLIGLFLFLIWWSSHARLRAVAIGCLEGGGRGRVFCEESGSACLSGRSVGGEC
jgi:hypothetical protein